MFSRSRHAFLAFALALGLLFAQFAVAAHGVVHPLEDVDTPHSQVCQHLVGHGLGSALPSTHHFVLGARFTPVLCAAPVVPRVASHGQRYHARAPPRI